MKTKITAALAVLLLAGASTAALAQEHDHERDAGGRRNGAAPAAVAPRAAPATQSPQGGHARFGAPPASGNPQVIRGEAAQSRNVQVPGVQHRDFQGQRFQGPAQVNGAAAPQRFDRGAGPGPGAGRQWDHERGPREVIPPRGDRGWDGRRDGHAAGAQADARNGQWAGGRGAGQHWRPGHYPPVFWSQQRYRVGAYRPPYGFYVRSWGFGDFLPRGWYGETYWLGDFLDYDLPYPPPGYEWVRVGGDALMVDLYTGRIVQVVRGIFW